MLLWSRSNALSASTFAAGDSRIPANPVSVERMESGCRHGGGSIRSERDEEAETERRRVRWTMVVSL
jgi:hypothetical protein